MASTQSSFLFYEATHEWQLSDPRSFLEIGYASSFSKNSPEIEYTVPLDGEKKSCPIYWYIWLYSGSDSVDSKPAVEFRIYTNTKENSIGKSVGLKLSLAILDAGNNILSENTGYNGLSSSSAVNTYVCSWYVKREVIPFDCPLIKICCTYQAYDITCGAVPAQASLAQPQMVSPPKGVEREYCEDMAHVLDKDRKSGASTDAMLKLGQTEYKVHKCILSLQSDFFKARFSDRWDAKDGDTRVVDMNDPELSPELLEALISRAYTVKVENFDMAVKIFPVADKYQFHTLKGVCEHLICSQLTRDNVLPVYMMATRCSALELQKKCETLVKKI